MPVATIKNNTIAETYTPRGASEKIFSLVANEVVVDGPAGTGKSRGLLEYVNYMCMSYPKTRALLVRKTRRSLTESGMVTFERHVLHPAQGVEWRAAKQQYQYPNGSILAVGGMDKPMKIMSSEWDLIYVQEATEFTETDWESCLIRLRNNITPLQQLIADCNPSAPSHWLKQRGDVNKTAMLHSRHEDNPLLFTDDGITEEGTRYLTVLDKLSGVLYSRYRLGLWAAAEGMVYQDTWDRNMNVIDRFPIPPEWPRYLSVDFGYTHPFICQWWAIDPDGRMYRYREIYHTQRLVEDHARTILDVSKWGQDKGDPFPQAIICDHDAEGRGTLERYLSLRTLPAQKRVSIGIEKVAARLRKAGDDKPRLFYMRDSVIERDPALVAARKPTCSEDEVESYIWQSDNGKMSKDTPVKDFDHGQDATRYMVCFFDLVPANVTYSNRVY